ncbi:ribonucleoside triphosphate reductase [candidate division KSB1 bacterium]
MIDSAAHRIRKRDGRLVPFEKEKITGAVFKATQAVNEPDRDKAVAVADQVTDMIEVFYKGNQIPTVENVQDLVEKILIRNGYADVAKSYILYRDQHTKIRETHRLFDEASNMVEDYLSRSDWRVNENSNMSYSLQGLNNYMSSVVTAQYWLRRLYPPEIREAHLRGDFHLHDLGQLSVYCCGWDLQDLLLRGFRGAYGKVESGPPRHLRVALGQIVNFFYTLQGEAAGAQAFSNFDTMLAPFIRYDGLEYKQVRQTVQEFVFNLNIPTRVGFQTPFTNISLDLNPPSTLRDQPVIIGGEQKTETYGEFQAEMDMINRALCEVFLEGDAVKRIFTFPIPTYNITSDFDWDNKVLEPLWAMTARYGIPYFSNFINSDLRPEDTRSMCCRLRLDNRELIKRGGGLFGSNPLTGSIGVVTLNLPRQAYLAKDKDDFRQRLDSLTNLARESLVIKRKALENLTDEGLYPYSKYYLAPVKESFGAYWVNHFSTIGLIGMNEACLNLVGGDIASPEGRRLAGETLDFLREKISGFQAETGDLFNLEATPAEGTSYRLARIDKRDHPDIIASGNGEPYYTNSSHLPVEHTDDLFLALKHQEELQQAYTGGTVFHGFLGESISDPAAARTLVRRIAETFRIPYYTLTPTFSICPVHGFLKGEQPACPVSLETGDNGGTCGRSTEVYSRVVGYFRPVQQWNMGKKAEFDHRKTYKLGAGHE